MGTWDHGLLDNDTAPDGLGDLVQSLLTDVEQIGAARPTLATTAKLIAALGLLLQLSAYSFEAQGPAQTIAVAVRAHAASIASFPPPVRRILGEVAAGCGVALARRPARMAALTPLLHVGAEQSPFGKREPSLFVSDAGAAHVQRFARRCVRMIDDDLADESTWSDLCRESPGMGALAALLVVAPCRVSPTKIEGWRRKARKGLAALEAAADEELPFQRLYYANLDRVFAALLRRFRAGT
jgi:hypothetical protein